MTDQKENYSVDFIINFIHEKRKMLFLVFFFCVLISIGIAYIITPLYESTAVFFPTQLGGVSKSLLSQNGDKEDFLQLGDEEVVEQFLQILSSDLIREKIVEKYNLFEHYDIDKKGKYPYTKLNEKYNNFISFSKTRYQSIQIDVLDPNPKYAANIANDIVNYLDSVINEMKYQRAFLAYKEVEKKYLGLEQEISTYQDSLSEIGKKGIVDYESQSKSLTEAYSNALLKGNNRALIIIGEQIDTLAKYGPVYNSLTNYLIFQREQLSLLRTKYIEAQVNAELKLPHKYVVKQAQIPEKKAYPIRWLVVMIITLSSLVLALFVLLFLEKKKLKFRLTHYDTNTLYILNFDIMEKFFRNKSLFEFIWKWKWIYVAAIILAIIASAIFSSPKFIKPKFKSVAIIYPSNLEEYSEESKTEQMLQVLQSEQLKLKLINAFNLYSHYKIDTKYQYAQTVIFGELNDNISISKTSYESVKIEVLDYYPDTAKLMVDSIISFYSQIVRTVQNAKYKEVIDIDKQQVNRLKKERDSLKAILTNCREKYNIYKPKLQSEQITEQYLKSNNPKSNKLYQNLIKHSEEIMLVDSLLQFNLKRLVGYKFNLDESMKNYKKRISYANIISSPIPADKKSYPIRWIILVLSVLGTFLFSFIALIFYESIQKKS